MALNVLPPQAYTKETLVQAYNWLRHQPPHIQELAKTPDMLISLYSKAQIHGDNALSRGNLQSFKKELSSLAGMMGDLGSTMPQNAFATSTPVEDTNLGTTFAPPPPPIIPPPIDMSQLLQRPPSVPAMTSPAFTAPEAKPDLIQALDSRSLHMILEIKHHFNLSSEQEALRLLISVGYQKVTNKQP